MEVKLREAIEEYGDMLFRKAFCMVGNRYDAEDIVQEVFLKYLISHTVFFSEKTKKAWLYKVTINKCRDFIRKKNTNKEIFITNLENIEKELVAEEKQYEFIQQVIELPLKYKEVIYLFYYEEFEIEEIAKIVKATPSAIKKRSQRGRTMLKDKTRRIKDER